MQEELNTLKTFTSENLMIIKERKTNVMKFNVSRTHDFPPELEIEGFKDKLQTASQKKLLGVFFSSDLKWLIVIVISAELVMW